MALRSEGPRPGRIPGHEAGPSIALTWGLGRPAGLEAGRHCWLYPAAHWSPGCSRPRQPPSQRCRALESSAQPQHTSQHNTATPGSNLFWNIPPSNGSTMDNSRSDPISIDDVHNHIVQLKATQQPLNTTSSEAL